jgi:uncharacterized integral membrane protein
MLVAFKVVVVMVGILVRVVLELLMLDRTAHIKIWYNCWFTHWCLVMLISEVSTVGSLILPQH